jgi:putative DNA primase/helicase
VLDNFIGSQAFIAAARVGHYCVEELGEEDDRGFRRPTGRVLYTVPKSSHSAPVPTLVFRKEVVWVGTDPNTGVAIEAPRLVWEGSVDLTAEEAVAANKPAGHDGRKARAVPVREFVRDVLAAGPVLQKIVVERGAEKGFSLDQLRRALKAVNGEAQRRESEGQNSPWYWVLSGQTFADSTDQP